MSKLSTTPPRWENQVVRTADGRLLVRGVDVPKSGHQWEKLVSGSKLSTAVKPRSRSGWALAPVTSKSEALEIARKAGLISTSKTASTKSSAEAKVNVLGPDASLAKVGSHKK